CSRRKNILNKSKTDANGRPYKMSYRFMKTKRREQAPALRYEIIFSAKVAEKSVAFSFCSQ
ncbi:MAG: hypothetical protein IJY39_06610, partial [Clostridia bacterium]|nr:hypothetical protein [Clostridia bacterium]